MKYSVFAVLVVIGVGVVLALVWNNRDKRSASPDEIDALLSKWTCWIEISNSEFKPIFQGLILGRAEGWEGIQFAGVLIEENIPIQLAEAIKKRDHSYASDGRILVRCLSVHDEEFIMSGLEDSKIISMLQPLIKDPDKIATRIALNSVYFQFMDAPENIRQFDTIWGNLIKKETGQPN